MTKIVDEKDMNISVVYTPLSTNGQYPNTISVPDNKLEITKQVIDSACLLRLNPYSKDNFTRYLWFGVFVDVNNNPEEGWSIRLECNEKNKTGLERVIQRIGLSSVKKE